MEMKTIIFLLEFKKRRKISSRKKIKNLLMEFRK